MGMGLYDRARCQSRGFSGANHSGVVLMIVLWILVILILLAAGLSRRGHVNTALSQMTVGQLRAKWMGIAAVRYAQTLIAQDSKDEKMSGLDTMYQCGFVLPQGASPEKLFKQVTFPEGSFEIVGSLLRTDGLSRYGFSDEESRINVNAITAANYQMLKFLIMDAGFEEEIATKISANVVDWVDEDDMVFREGYSRENTGGDPVVKNSLFQSLEELLLIDGMTLEIYEAIKDDVTVYPAQTSLLINLNTATPRALRALARNFTGVNTNTELSDADFLVEKILKFRAGPDGIEATADDRPVINQDLRLNNRETTIMAQMEGYKTDISYFLRMGIRVKESRSNVENLLEVVIARADGKIVYWRKIK